MYRLFSVALLPITLLVTIAAPVVAYALSWFEVTVWRRVTSRRDELIAFALIAGNRNRQMARCAI